MNYLFNAELISNRKFTPSQIEKIKNEIESNEDSLRFYPIFLELLEIGFGGILEIYAEDLSFEIDVTSEIEELIEKIDSLIPGGWSTDSKIELVSDHPALVRVWYKDKKEWKDYISDSYREDLVFSEKKWRSEDSYDTSYENSYGEYDSEDDW
jgi:hypothetical protein